MLSVLMINVGRGLVGLIGALFVVTGVIKVDSDYDNYGDSQSIVGKIFFFTGWILFASSIGILNNDLSGLIFNSKALLGVIGSLLVIAAATLSQLVMYKKNIVMMRIHLIFFIFAWCIMAYAISIPSGAVGAGQFVKFVIALIGALGVIMGMMFQMKYRKRGFDFIATGKISLANAYSPGLPFFTAGWLFLAFANALV